MEVIEIFPGNYGVRNNRGALVKSGFATPSEAWRWIDRQTDEGRSHVPCRPGGRALNA
jgi:hypothetical protein